MRRISVRHAINQIVEAGEELIDEAAVTAAGEAQGSCRSEGEHGCPPTPRRCRAGTVDQAREQVAAEIVPCRAGNRRRPGARSRRPLPARRRAPGRREESAQKAAIAMPMMPYPCTEWNGFQVSSRVPQSRLAENGENVGRHVEEDVEGRKDQPARCTTACRAPSLQSTMYCPMPDKLRRPRPRRRTTR